MNDPFSSKIRKRVPWYEYCRYTWQLSDGSLMGRDLPLPEEAMRNRIAELAEIERESGVVYVGEKKWLEECCTSSSLLTYSTWVQRQLEGVFSEPSYVQPGYWNCYNGKERSYEDLDYWEMYTEDLSPIPLLDSRHVSKVENQPYTAVECNCIQLLLPGDASNPDLFSLQQVFEILHNLQYYLELAYTYRSEPVIVDEVVLEHESMRWRMGLANEYGMLGYAQFRSDSSLSYSVFEHCG